MQKYLTFVNRIYIFFLSLIHTQTRFQAYPHQSQTFTMQIVYPQYKLVAKLWQSSCGFSKLKTNKQTNYHSHNK